MHRQSFYYHIFHRVYALCMPAVWLLAGLPLSAQPGEGRIEIPADQITCICASGGPGSISLIAEGSAGPFTFLWAGPAGYASTEQNPTDLPAPGQYSVTVTNAYGCAVTLEAEVPACDPIQMQAPNVLHPPSSCSASDGLIRWIFGNPVTGGTHPYTFLWNTGHTSLLLTDLPVGTYHLTVTEGGGCQGVFSYSLGSQNMPEPFIETIGTCEGREEGTIIVYMGGSQDWSYNFEWSNGVSDLGTTGSEQSGLSPGEYTLTITETNTGCSRVEVIEVLELQASSPLVVDGAVLNGQCSGGRINLNITGGIPPYQIVWNPSSLYGDQVTGLFSGVYCATATDNCGNTASNCFEVTDAESQRFRLVVVEIKHVSSSGQSDGKIRIDALPAGEYAYSWSNGSSGNALNGLTPGNYDVTVTNTQTGCSISTRFVISACENVKDFDIKAYGDISFTGDEALSFQVEIKVDDGTFEAYIPPGYSVTWTDQFGGVLGHEQSLTIPADYAMADIRVRVSNGCKEILKQIPIVRCNAPTTQDLSKFFIVETTNPCKDFAEGSAVIRIPNPHHHPLVVSVSGLGDFPVSSQRDPEILEIGGLRGNVTFAVGISIGGCNFSFNFKLEEQDLTLEYNRLENNTTCIFNTSCGEHDDLGETEISAFLHWANSTGGFLQSCTTPVLCGNIQRGELSFNKKYTTAQQYLINLNQAMVNGYPADYITPLLVAAQERIGNQLCSRVRYCSKNLRWVGIEPMFWGGGRIPSSPPVFDPSTGCISVNCPWPTPDYLACASDADLFFDNLNLNNCVYTQAKLNYENLCIRNYPEVEGQQGR